MRTAIWILSVATVISAALPAQRDSSSKDDATRAVGVEEFVVGKTHLPGFVDLLLDDETGEIHLALGSFDEDLLYATAQASGLGSNPVGLDRGSLGAQHVIVFHRAGPKVLVLAKNLRYRALSDNLRERLAVTESFAPSVLVSLPIVAESGQRVVVNATALFLRDATGVVGRLQRAEQGKFTLDPERSALWPQRTKSFVDNTEVEVLLTFASDKPGDLVQRTAAAGSAVTLRQHHSLIRLPDDGYRPRRFDPRVGYFGLQFADYAAPLGESMHRHFIARHRLQKKDPTAPLSEPIEPIVYYIDPGTPEPIRSALREGAMWWAPAFEAAGFQDAFRVEVLPDGADPMDVRYHMIHWVHRRTRGWSYGASIRDPRTGEILKGNVLLGSLRLRQDHLKLVGLQSPFAAGGCAAGDSPGAGHLLPVDDAEAQRVALARIRQLAAHEVGHTLGLSHNFAASTFGRASVMDYPAPMVGIGAGDVLDFSNAYGVGVGAYDKWAIAYGYSEFAAGTDEAAKLDELVRSGLARGFVLLTDQDARAAGSSHPLASLWDNGTDPVARLEHEIRVREIGLRRFGIASLRPGATHASLEDVLVPLYLHHRFQLSAAIKWIGGVDFRHAVKGDGQRPLQAVPAERQREALRMVLQTVRPDFLRLDPRILKLIPPSPPGHPATAERFPRSTGQILDPVALATIAADLTIRGLLHPQRAARLVHLDADGFGFEEVLRALAEAVIGLAPDDSGLSAIERAVESVLVDRLMDLAIDRSAADDVRAMAELRLLGIGEGVAGRTTTQLEGVAHTASLRRRIDAFLTDPDRDSRRVPDFAAPPGSPIGNGG